MSVLLADLLSDLREDHRNMTIVLDLLGQQVEHVCDGDQPDYELVHDIMRYMTVYSDAVHHPKEDLLYSTMQSDQAHGLERVESEHRRIAELGAALRNDVEAIASGAAVTREKLCADTTNYVRTLRQHMAWEDEDLFRRAEDLLPNKDAVPIDISQLDKLDPVFGPQRQHSFANLLQNIKDLAG